MGLTCLVAIAALAVGKPQRDDEFGNLKKQAAKTQPPVVARVEPPRAPQPQTPRTGQTKVDPRDGLTYVWIAPGTFIMGCSPGDRECSDSEKPAHQVTITRGFWIGQTLVTQEAYRRLERKKPGHFKGARLPVETVTWNAAQAYCQEGGMRLPTEAEWEYAARAGTTGSRYGDIDQIAWYGANSGSTTHEVGQRQANQWGLFDMLGNVWQWTADWYTDKYTGSGETDPHGPASGQFRALRGGSWNDTPRMVRVSYRYINRPANRYYIVGFRCAWN